MPARAVEREHVLRAEPFAKRVLGDQRLELADDVAVMPEREVGLDPPFECGEAELLEARALVPGERLRELGERRPAPERERATQQLPRLPRLVLRERLPAVGDGALEAGQVELARHRPRAGSREGVCCSRGSGSAFRSCETWICTIFWAESGTSSPQRASTICSRETVRFAFRSRIARSARCLPAAICSGAGRRRPPAGREAENPSRDAIDATTSRPSVMCGPATAQGVARDRLGAPGGRASQVGRWTSVAAAPRKKSAHRGAERAVAAGGERRAGSDRAGEVAELHRRGAEAGHGRPQARAEWRARTRSRPACAPPAANAAVENRAVLVATSGRATPEEAVGDGEEDGEQDEGSPRLATRRGGGRSGCRRRTRRPRRASRQPVSLVEVPYDSAKSAPAKTSVPAQAAFANSSDASHRASVRSPRTARARAGGARARRLAGARSDEDPGRDGGDERQREPSVAPAALAQEPDQRHADDPGCGLADERPGERPRPQLGRHPLRRRERPRRRQHGDGDTDRHLSERQQDEARSRRARDRAEREQRRRAEQLAAEPDPSRDSCRASAQ